MEYLNRVHDSIDKEIDTMTLENPSFDPHNENEEAITEEEKIKKLKSHDDFYEVNNFYEIPLTEDLVFLGTANEDLTNLN